MPKSKKNLLPSGFYDSMQETSFKELESNYLIIKKFKEMGYELVRPSIMEFEQSLDRSVTSEFFKVTDPLSGKMMVLRNDITPQIARIVKDRLYKDSKEIRISYTGQIFRKSGKGKFAERQITQTGVELINSYKPVADTEIILTAAKILEFLGVKNFTIDFCIPSLLREIIGTSLEKNEISKIQKAIEQKNLSELKSKKLSKIIEIINIADEVSNIKEAESAIKKIKKLTGKNKSLEEAEKVVQLLSKKIGKLNISFNILEEKNFKYHSGLCYSIVSGDSYEEIARGGRYEIEVDKSKISAVGVTLILNSLLRIIPNKKNR